MTKDEIKSRFTIADVLRSHNIPMYRGGRCKPICHDSDRKSKNAAYRSDLYTCFVCNKSFDVIGLEMELSGCDFQTACRLISGEDLTSEEMIERSRREAAQRAKEAEEERQKREHRELVSEYHRISNEASKAADAITESWEHGEKFAELLKQKQRLLGRLEYGS